ncbi:EF-hand domain-containing protein [Salinisphaera sp. LB1]|uniref:EF-hand domain-containing protein n=1 Tax=Salinisphaera sp. LB1 TaxID=2183911 RepID=UPI000D7D3F23|nr:EF-hand domain-containing protein [Salinisphaera sp. LB1]AWN14816.1 EF hand domain protein [Salinisphaera sp. LB1]
MKKYLTLSLLVAGLSVSAAGFAADNGAADHDPDSQAIFKKLDTNGDGRLTAAEMTRLREVIKQQMFDKLDTNHDGKIEKSEFEAQAKARADHLFAKLDANGDGVISADEMKPPMGRHHMGPPEGDMPPPPPSSHPGNAPGPGDHDHHRRDHHEGHRRSHRGKPSTDEIFAHMDRNNDGYVSAAEWNEAAQHWHHHPHDWHEPDLDQTQGKAD